MDISLAVYSIYYLYKSALSDEIQFATKNTREIESTIINHKVNWKKERGKKKEGKKERKHLNYENQEYIDVPFY